MLDVIYRNLKHDVIANFHGTFFALNIVSNRTVELLPSAARTGNVYAVQVYSEVSAGQIA
jgi:hypothetical protein